MEGGEVPVPSEGNFEPAEPVRGEIPVDTDDADEEGLPDEGVEMSGAEEIPLPAEGAGRELPELVGEYPDVESPGEWEMGPWEHPSERESVDVDAFDKELHDSLFAPLPVAPAHLANGWEDKLDEVLTGLNARAVL